MTERVPPAARRSHTAARRGRQVVVVALAAGLCGCVSLLPKGAPVQLYRFGAAPSATAPQALVGRGRPTLGVILSEVTLPRAALGDGVLTVKGPQAAYIAGARWVSPAALMFRDAAETAFEGRSGPVRLLDRTELAAASTLLRLDVTEFDARYDSTGAGPPTAVVRLRATLVRADGASLVERSFGVERPCGEDRVSAIVAGLDAATAEVLGQVVDWTAAQTPGLAAGLPPDAPTQPLPLHSTPPIGLR